VNKKQTQHILVFIMMFYIHISSLNIKIQRIKQHTAPSVEMPNQNYETNDFESCGVPLNNVHFALKASLLHCNNCRNRLLIESSL